MDETNGVATGLGRRAGTGRPPGGRRYAPSRILDAGQTLLGVSARDVDHVLRVGRAWRVMRRGLGLCRSGYREAPSTARVAESGA